jgi:type II secretory pathway pseudopilin PulG
MEHRVAIKQTKAFTLMELLVVISIIVLLIGMLMPALSGGRKAARDTTCKSQLRQVAIAFDVFTIDHRDHLPGTYTSVWVGPEPWQKSWMGKETWPVVTFEGTIIQYISGGAQAAKKLYRCPDLPQGGFRSGSGSNGLFDYTSLLSFSGAKFTGVPAKSKVIDPTTQEVRSAFTPLVVEEDPLWHVNNCCVDPGHSNVDRLGQWHSGSGNYASLDSHVESLRFTNGLGPTTHDWTALTPSGVEVSLTAHGSGWAGWNTR